MLHAADLGFDSQHPIRPLDLTRDSDKSDTWLGVVPK